jgi:hypothetical protein
MNEQLGSYIDMKECLFVLQDAYSEAGAVNKVGGYAKGDTSIVVDTFDVELEVGLQVVFTGHSTVYHIVSHSETSSVTTGIVITPALTTTVADDVVITAGPHQLQIKIGDGTFSYTETKNREYKLDRGLIDKVRNGDEAPMEVSTTFAWTYITNVTAETEIPSIEDFLKRR